MWKERLRNFQTAGEHTTSASEVWFWVLMDDHWIEKKFGKLEQTQTQTQTQRQLQTETETETETQEENYGRTIFCHFSVWRNAGAQPGDEEAIAADPHAWDRELAEVMPPVTAWERERWDIREIPQ